MAAQHRETPGTFEDRLQVIQNRFRCYSPVSVLHASLEYLYEPVSGEHGRLMKHPWQTLLLLKWVFLDPLAMTPGRPAIDRVELIGILQLMYELSNKGRRPSDYEDVTLFLRAAAYQQFVHQGNEGMVDLARQQALFAQVPENHFFRTRFFRSTSVPVDDFLLLSLTTLAGYGADCYVMKRDHLFDLFPTKTPDVIDAFLRAVSIDVDKLPAALAELDVSGRSADEFVEPTPFMRHPLVKVGSEYWCINQQILQRSLGHFIYDKLKQDDNDRFSSPFGSAFEKYVEQQLSDQSCLAYAAEQDLIRHLPAGKVVDFLVVDGDANIFIDAKGVEMSVRGRTTHRRDIVHQATKTSLIKAFEQGLDVCTRIAKHDLAHPIIRTRKTNFLLAVTYKQLYIANGRRLANAIGADRMQQIRSQYAADDKIPDENIYFLTIGEFEVLMAMVALGRIGLAEALERAKVADSSPHTQKFFFDQHIASWPESTLPNLIHPLDVHLGSLIEGLRTAFPG